MEILRNYIPKPWKELANVLIRYITPKGRYNKLYAHHFSLINHFCFLEIDRVNFSFFILNSMSISIRKFMETLTPWPIHGGVITLVYEIPLKNIPRRMPRVGILIGD